MSTEPDDDLSPFAMALARRRNSSQSAMAITDDAAQSNTVPTATTNCTAIPMDMDPPSGEEGCSNTGNGGDTYSPQMRQLCSQMTSSSVTNFKLAPTSTPLFANEEEGDYSDSADDDDVQPSKTSADTSNSRAQQMVQNTMDTMDDTDDVKTVSEADLVDAEAQLQGIGRLMSKLTVEVVQKAQQREDRMKQDVDALNRALSLHNVARECSRNLVTEALKRFERQEAPRQKKLKIRCRAEIMDQRTFAGKIENNKREIKKLQRRIVELQQLSQEKQDTVNRRDRESKLAHGIGLLEDAVDAATATDLHESDIVERLKHDIAQIQRLRRRHDDDMKKHEDLTIAMKTAKDLHSFWSPQIRMWRDGVGCKLEISADVHTALEQLRSPCRTLDDLYTWYTVPSAKDPANDYTLWLPPPPSPHLMESPSNNSRRRPPPQSLYSINEHRDADSHLDDEKKDVAAPTAGFQRASQHPNVRQQRHAQTAPPPQLPGPPLQGHAIYVARFAAQATPQQCDEPRPSGDGAIYAPSVWPHNARLTFYGVDGRTEGFLPLYSLCNYDGPFAVGQKMDVRRVEPRDATEHRNAGYAAPSITSVQRAQRNNGGKIVDLVYHQLVEEVEPWYKDFNGIDGNKVRRITGLKFKIYRRDEAGNKWFGWVLCWWGSLLQCLGRVNLAGDEGHRECAGCWNTVSVENDCGPLAFYVNYGWDVVGKHGKPNSQTKLAITDVVLTRGAMNMITKCPVPPLAGGTFPVRKYCSRRKNYADYLSQYLAIYGPRCGRFYYGVDQAMQPVAANNNGNAPQGRRSRRNNSQYDELLKRHAGK